MNSKRSNRLNYKQLDQKNHHNNLDQIDISYLRDLNRNFNSSNLLMLQGHILKRRNKKS